MYDQELEEKLDEIRGFLAFSGLVKDKRGRM